MVFYAHTPAEDSEVFHPLEAHLTKVALKAQGFASKFNAGELGYYAGLWHDLGKYNPEFQKYLQQSHADTKAKSDNKRQGTPHAIYGAMLADRECYYLAPIVYGHHGGIPSVSTLKTKKLNEPKYQPIYKEVLEIAKQDLGKKLFSDRNLDEIFREVAPQYPSGKEVFVRLLFSCLVDADSLDTESHFHSDRTALRQGYQRKNFAELWSIFSEDREKFVLRNKQGNNNTNIGSSGCNVSLICEEVYQACCDRAVHKASGIFKLAAPTGAGKTRSSLAFAIKHSLENQKDRIIVAVPYTSIIEQTVKVYRDILGEESVLEHHSAVKIEMPGDAKDEFNQFNEGAQRDMAQARLLTENWDAPIVVTTTVQLFESLFSNRPSKCRKLHNIVNSTIILDEVQTLPVKLLQSIVNMLEELVKNYNVSVVLSTATQPALDSISGYFKGFDRALMRDIIEVERSRQMFQQLKRVEYDTTAIRDNIKWSCDRLKSDLESCDRALVILNTRKDALVVLDSLEIKRQQYLNTQLPVHLVEIALRESKVLHLSTLLCGAHRRAVLDEVKRRLMPNSSEPCLLISTQVVEAGVDLDFPRVYRAIAPLDRIVQAAGRCNRKGLRSLSESQVFIFELEDGSCPVGEYKKATEKTKELLENASFDFHNPTIFRSYFETLYKLNSVDSQKIEDCRASFNFPEVASRFKLIDDKSIPVIVPYDEVAQGLLQEIERRGARRDDFRQLQPYTVSLPQKNFNDFIKQRNIAPLGSSETIFVLQEGLYDPIRGIPFGQDAGDWNYDPATLIY